MTFRRNARLNTGQVRDLRGGGGVAVGGGLAGVIVLVAVMLLGGDPSQIPSDLLNGITTGTAQENDLSDECQTGEDANRRKDCRIVGYVNSVQDYWDGQVADYQPAPTTFFTGSVSTQCGNASSDVGPFYCPNDQTIYIDLTFFDQLESQLGAEDGPLSEAYVIAHEYGHHVQNLNDVLRAGGGTGAESYSVRTELQADCYAGIWMFHAVDTGYLVPITDDQVANAMQTAKAIGDDRIQRQTQGEVNKEAWTHGSSEQRAEWLTTGLNSGDPGDCDTFNADL